jgi:Spy/CpxP family protein refolding chaperone
MKKTLVTRITTSVAGAFVALSAATLAMGPSGGDHDPGRMLSHLSERLELTDDQQDQVEGIIQAGKTESAADRQRLHELREELMDMAPGFDPDKARKAADEIGDITGRMVYRHASTYAEFYALLTDEQRASLEQLAAERGERRQNRWRKHRE